MPEEPEVFVQGSSGDGGVGRFSPWRLGELHSDEREQKTDFDAPRTFEDEHCDGGVHDPEHFEEPQRPDIDSECGVGQCQEDFESDRGIFDVQERFTVDLWNI